jgi:hypothetical protein
LAFHKTAFSSKSNAVRSSDVCEDVDGKFAENIFVSPFGRLTGYGFEPEIPV